MERMFQWGAWVHEMRGSDGSVREGTCRVWWDLVLILRLWRAMGLGAYSCAWNTKSMRAYMIDAREIAERYKQALPIHVEESIQVL